MQIALDAMGSDCAPGPEIEGAISVLSAHPGIEIVLVGKEDVIRQELKKYGVTHIAIFMTPHLLVVRTIHPPYAPTVLRPPHRRP